MSNQGIERKPNGQFAKGVSGNLGGNAQHTRHLVNKAFLQSMEQAIEAARAMLDQREKALDAGQLIEGKAEPVALPASGQGSQGER